MPEIRIDTAELTYPWFWIPGHLAHFLDGSVPGGAVVNLDPGEYPFQQTRDHPCDVGVPPPPELALDLLAAAPSSRSDRSADSIRDSVRGAVIPRLC